jgi:hypothetical protein
VFCSSSTVFVSATRYLTTSFLQMPLASVEYANHAARSPNTPPTILMLRDFKTQITPNDTQRITMIVAGVYFIAILLLW